MDNEDYMDKVKYQIELNKLLATIPPKKRKEAKILYDQKLEIIKKNSFFADWQLKRINQKIEKLKNVKN